MEKRIFGISNYIFFESKIFPSFRFEFFFVSCFATQVFFISQFQKMALKVRSTSKHCANHFEAIIYQKKISLVQKQKHFFPLKNWKFFPKLCVTLWKSWCLSSKPTDQIRKQNPCLTLLWVNLALSIITKFKLFK